MTKTGKLGYFGGAKIPTVTIFGVGFQQGMEAYNAAHGTSVELIGWDNATGEGSFTGDFVDLVKGKEDAQSLFDEGARYLHGRRRPDRLHGLPIAQRLHGHLGRRGRLVQWADCRDVILTSVMKRLDNPCSTRSRPRWTAPLPAARLRRRAGQRRRCACSVP